MSGTQTITLTRSPTKTTVGAADAPTVTTAAVEIPKDLGPVTLVRELGKGGMGVVWLGKHTMLNRDVAVKFLLNMVTSDDDPHFAMFLEGARAAAALQHKGLNGVLNADVVGGVPFIVMDYVAGPTLAQVLHRAGDFPLAAARVVMEAACDAVASLHEADVIHRDIKPANILLAADGTPILTDFGLACTRSVVLTGAKVEAVAGTPDYMAPEMFDRVVSPRSDVYALGVMFYEMLTGRLPFDGDFEQVRTAHREVPVPLDDVRASFPMLADVIDRATTKNPMFRVKSARHLLIAVQDAFSQIDPMTANRAKGEAELVTLVQRSGHGGGGEGRATPTPEAGGTYYDRLSTIAAKRKSGEPATDREMTPAPLMESVTVGTACVRCKASLDGQPTTGRCPSCLLLVRYTLDPAAYAAMPKAAPPRPAPAPAAQSAPTPQSPRPESTPGLWSRLRKRFGG